MDNLAKTTDFSIDSNNLDSLSHILPYVLLIQQLHWKWKELCHIIVHFLHVGHFFSRSFLFITALSSLLLLCSFSLCCVIYVINTAMRRLNIFWRHKDKLLIWTFSFLSKFLFSFVFVFDINSFSCSPSGLSNARNVTKAANSRDDTS